MSLINKILILSFSIISLFINDRYEQYEYYFVILLLIVILVLYKKINFGFKILPYIGLISYTWYLIHNAIGIIIIRELNKLDFQIISIFIAIIITFILSILIYNFLEIKSKYIILNFYKKYKFQK